MRRIQLGLAIFLFSLLPGFAQQTVPPAPATAPAAPASNPRAPYTSSPGEGRIHLDVVVTDKSGKPVSGLNESDFTLKDNNQPAKIVSFHAIDSETEKVPTTEIILVLDAVNLGFDTVSRSRQQIDEFLRRDGGHLAAPVSIFLFTDQGMKVLLQPSTDGNALAAQLEKAVSGLRTIGRSAQYRGIELFELSLKWMTIVADTEAKRPGRKMMIWAGPGWPLLDSPRLGTTVKGEQQMFDTIVSLSTELREGHMTLYSVSMGDPHLGTYLYQDYLKGVKTPDKAVPPDLSLKVLAVHTGGLVLGPDNFIAPQIATAARDADAFYTLSFDPPPADRPNEYHDLKVEIDKPGLTARTSTGYYNQR